jgi:hypothetical protein
MSSKILIVLLIPIITSCEAGGIQGLTQGEAISDSEEAEPIRTSSDTYPLEAGPAAWTVEIPFEYWNRTEGTDYYLVHCNGAFDFRLEKRVGEEWVEAYGPVLPQCLSLDPIHIAPNEVWSATIWVYAVDEEGIAPRFLDDDPVGTFRIVLPTLSAFDPDVFPFGPTIPKADRVSNSFDLEV